jgi:hypothetical protein
MQNEGATFPMSHTVACRKSENESATQIEEKLDSVRFAAL